MPIPGIAQPELLQIADTLRLRRFSGECAFALPWYQDMQLLRMVDGERARPYDVQRLAQMYRYLDAHGELYWIEQLRDAVWTPVGDVTFSSEDLPIVLGNAADRGKGLGTAVITALISRAWQLGFKALCVQQIYDWNLPSQRLFTRCGFVEDGKAADGKSYRLSLS